MCLDSWQKSPQAFGHDHGLQVLHLHPLVLRTKRVFEEMSPAWPEPRYGARRLQLLSPLLGVWSKSVTCPLHISPLKWRGHLPRGPTSQDGIASGVTRSAPSSAGPGEQGAGSTGLALSGPGHVLNCVPRKLLSSVPAPGPAQNWSVSVSFQSVGSSCNEWHRGHWNCSAESHLLSWK